MGYCASMMGSQKEVLRSKSLLDSYYWTQSFLSYKIALPRDSKNSEKTTFHVERHLGWNKKNY